MQIAVWNTPPADLLASGFHSGAFMDRVEVIRAEIFECEALLRNGSVDAALLPTVSILKNADDFSVVPAVALSSWAYPFARLSIDHGLNEAVRTVACDPRFEQERLLTDVVLREHYGTNVDFLEIVEASREDLLESDADARLMVGPDVPGLSVGELILDLGQEWFELAQYPMVWGLFATLKQEISPELIRTIRDGVRLSEKQRPIWIRAQETSAELHEFYHDGLRLRLDDLVIASLTELKQFLFYYDMIDEVRDIPFAFLPDDEDEEGKKPLL